MSSPAAVPLVLPKGNAYATASVKGSYSNAGSNSAASAGNKVARRQSAKVTHSRSYPRGVGLDFRKLAGLSLINYIDHHGMFL